MKILITGAGGMVGSHMIDHYHAEGEVSITGTFFRPTTDITDIAGKATLKEVDVRYLHGIAQVIMEERPDKIFHLGAQSYPTISWERPQETMDINVNGTVNVFESVKLARKQSPDYDPVVVVACSSAQYGASLTPENVPITEDAAFMPLHPYGVSKVAQDLLSYQYFRSDGIRSIRARIFNTTGPRKANDVVADFTHRARLIELGRLQKMRVGNLQTKRAITDVRDLVQALVLLSDKGHWGEAYNISGNKVYTIAEIIPLIEEVIGRGVEIETDPKLLRPTDEPIIYGDSSRLKAHTGWEQQYDLRTTITDMVDYLRTKIL